jgi:hypothetical protein
MAEPVWFRWLGVAGIELRVRGHSLLIDPFVSRPPLRRMWLGRAEPDRALIEEKVPRGDVLLVTHAHWDHIMDAPDVAQRTGAVVYGSSNACQLLAVCGIPQARVHSIAAGHHVYCDPFQIEVLPAVHGTILGWPIFTGPLAADLRPPLRLRDYRMDVTFSFLVRAAGYQLLDWSSDRIESAVPADVLFVKPHTPRRAYYAELLRTARPRLVIPLHWDDFLRPLSKPVRPLWRRPAWSARPLRRIDLAEFRQMIHELAPRTRVFVPEMFRPYDLRQLL